MAIQSFLIYTTPDRMPETCEALRAIPGTDLTPAENQNIVILVAETAGKAEMKDLEATLDGLPGVDGYALVAGFSDEAIAHSEFAEELV